MPMQKSEQLREQGNTFFKQQHYDKALECYENATKESNDNIKAWSNLGICHKKLENINEAMAAFERVLELDAMHVKAMQNLVDIFRKLDLEKSPELALKVFSFRQRHQAKLCFLSADYKLTNDGRVIILEITRGLQSGHRGAFLHGQFLKDLLPAAATKARLPAIVMTKQKGHQCVDKPLAAVMKEKIKVDPSTAQDLRTLSSYKSCYVEFELPPTPIACPYLMVDDINVAQACEDKSMLHQTCVRAKQTHVRPRTFVLDRNQPYSPALLSQIKSHVGEHGKYVIKAPGQEESRGVIIVSSADLPDILPRLFLSEEQAAYEFARKHPELLKSILKTKINPPEINMLTDDKGCFLVEEYIANKPIVEKGKMYDPTGRAFFLVARDNDVCRYIPIDNYWRLPDKSIREKGVALRDKIIPSYRKDTVTVATVNPADNELIHQQFSGMMPAIISNLFERDLLAEFAKEPQPKVKYYGYLMYANSATLLGNYPLVEYCFARAKETIPSKEYEYRVYHELGILRTRQGKYAEAIGSFNTAIQFNSASEISYLRRGIAYHLQGDVAKCQADLKTAAKTNPRRVEVLAAEYGISLKGIT
jgi:tetratricopeptide (TPR) repeat protein